MIWERYHRALTPWATAHDVRLPVVPPHCDQSWHLFHMLMPSPESRTRLLVHLRALGIQAAFHYQPLHCSPMGRALGGREGQCPVAEAVADRLLRLPFWNDLDPAWQQDVIDGVVTAPLLPDLA